ncbi:uncharacterized protein LOC132199763 [Neocloeon triangulifer]|uniref:uncharacterized protein LOC132199763 n=1 Tax=Neocloeon triangulifer TaxID=2078957 RepID=UPI00286ED167|nr:uncharacterized protein LOC132199763 [Neocloeon triangulifer]
MMRIEEFAKTLSAKSATNQSHSSAQIDLSTLALVKEYVYKYITMDIPIDVKRWYTYVRKQVQRLNLLEQDDPLLIQFIREQLLVPPFIKEPESKAKKKPGNYSKDISSFLEIFRNKEKGFFVEIGNNFTKSQIFEADFSWEGVLIDKDPDSVNKLLDKKRKAWIVPTCLSLKSTPEMVIFVNTTRKEANREIIEIHCMPINTIFASLNISRVDYLHLDVHGRENEAFTRLNLTSFPVHVVEIGKSADQKEKNLLKKHLESAAFKLLALKNETDRLIYVNPANAK